MFGDIGIDAPTWGGPSREEMEQAQERGLRMWALEQAIKTTSAIDSETVLGIAARYIDYVNGEDQ